MNTEDAFLAKDFITDWNSLEIFDFTLENKKHIVGFVEKVRFIQEVEQLFCVYKSNLAVLLAVYTLYESDIVERKMELPCDCCTDYSNINAFVTNVISSGKTLINAMIVYIKNAYGPGSSEYSEFKTTYPKKEYDDSFGYRFLTRLRDFSQHGHLPVSMMKTERGNVAWFDIDRILKTPHFHHNETIAANLEELRESILKDFGSTARIAFAFTIAQYNLSVVTIYSSFYGSVKDDFFRICDKVDNHLIEYPEAIIKADGYPNGMVGYLDDDDTSHLHIFNPEDKTREMFVGFSEKANITLQKDTEEMELLKLSFKFPAK